MPKVPARKQMRDVEPERVKIREFSAELEVILTDLYTMRLRVEQLYLGLTTKGLDDAGPITESKDDIPF